MARPTVPSSVAVTDHVIDVASGVVPADAPSSDRRRGRRFRYDALVAATFLGPTGERTQPLVLKSRDISMDGICVVSRGMLYPGSLGAVQLVRSNGEAALVGVRVQHCRYAGAMQHHIGLQFVPLPGEIYLGDFVDRSGKMILLDPALRNNVRP